MVGGGVVIIVVVGFLIVPKIKIIEIRLDLLSHYICGSI